MSQKYNKELLIVRKKDPNYLLIVREKRCLNILSFLI